MSKLVLLFCASGLTFSQAHALVSGSRTEFRSPRGQTEFCVALDHAPEGNYSAKDSEAEAKFCALDLYAPTVALCPKTWSTSPGTMVYDTEGLSTAQYEATRCSGKNGHVKLAKFKNTLNGELTSSTFSTASLLYYHFSRYFNTQVDVPVAVYRTIDKDVHYQRVSSGARGLGKMNPAGWDVLREAELNPATYSAIDELFTPDRAQIFGVLLKGGGTGYGPEIDGTQAGGWGSGQNNDFQNTPGFLALRSAQPLAQAAAEGLSQAVQDPILQKAMGANSNPAQIVYWMRDLSEITLLDYIFSQEDRIENIDYSWEWTYVDGGQVKSVKVKEPRFESLPRTRMSSIPVPAEIAQFKPILLQRTSINDNDAAGRTQYTNFTKKTQMLEKIRHFNGDIYRKLVALNQDFASQGSLYRYSAQTFGLTPRQLGQLTGNTALALSILKATCKAGQMRFDLKPKAFMVGQATEESVDCENP